MNKQKAIFENQNNTMLIHIALRAEDQSQKIVHMGNVNWKVLLRNRNF